MWLILKRKKKDEVNLPFSEKYYAKSSKPNSHILHHLPKPIHQQATNSLASGDETIGFYPHNHNRTRLWEWGRRRCMESDRRRGRVVSSLSLSLSHLPFLRTYSATLPSHSHPQFFLLLLKRNQWIHFQTPSIPTSALKKSLSFSLTLFHFSFYICLLLIFFFFF